MVFWPLADFIMPNMSHFSDAWSGLSNRDEYYFSHYFADDGVRNSFFTKPTYLSIGAFSHNKFPVTTIQQGLIVWDIPRWVLVGSICILALALKLSEKTIDLVADSLQTNYATVIEKSKTILMEW